VVRLLFPIAAIAGNLAGWWIGGGPVPPSSTGPTRGGSGPGTWSRPVGSSNATGGRTIVLARFVPVVRTFATVMAGASRMPFRRFPLCSVIGGIAWTTAVMLLGYWLGQVAVVPDHVELFILGIVVLSLVPVVVEALPRRTRA